MPSPSLLPLLFLSLLSVLAGNAIIGLSIRNGWIDMHTTLLSSALRLLPYSNVEARSSYVGIKAIDEWLTGLVVVFWPAATGANRELSLFAVYMAGQIWALHGLVMTEGARKAHQGGRGRWLRFSTAWGMLYQTVPWGVIMPIYWLVYLWTSPLAYVSTSATKSLADPTVQFTASIALPLSLGYGLPTLLIGLSGFAYATSSFTHYPVIGYPSTTQALLAIWQIFPLLVGGVQFFMSVIPQSTSPTSSQVVQGSAAGKHADSKTNTSTQPTGLSRLYAPLSTASQTVHWYILTVALFTSRSLPLTTLLTNVFLPTARVVTSFAEGVHILLVWDLWFAVGASVFAAAILLRRARGMTVGDTLLDVAWRVVVLGPAGAVVTMVWKRDEVLGERGDAVRGF